jgi:hypothetical protein
MESEKRGYRAPVEPGQKVTMSIRTHASTKNEILAAAKEEGANLSEMGEELWKAALRDRKRALDILGEASRFAYGGPDNAGLVRLFGEVVREFFPRGVSLDDPAAIATISRASARTFARLRAPEDLHVFQDQSIEGRVDALLFHLGDDGTDHPGPALTRQRWAKDVREHLGAALSERLAAMRIAVRDHLQSLPPAPPPTNPKSEALWDNAFASQRLTDAWATEHERRTQQALTDREAGEARRRAKREPKT